MGAFLLGRTSLHSANLGERKMRLAAFNAKTSAHCSPRRVSGRVLACGRARDRVAMDDETGVPRAVVVRLALLA